MSTSNNLVSYWWPVTAVKKVLTPTVEIKSMPKIILNVVIPLNMKTLKTNKSISYVGETIQSISLK